MCKSISLTGCFGYDKMLRGGLEIFFKNVFHLAHCMNRFPNSADPKDD